MTNSMALIMCILEMFAFKTKVFLHLSLYLAHNCEPKVTIVGRKSYHSHNLILLQLHGKIYSFVGLSRLKRKRVAWSIDEENFLANLIGNNNQLSAHALANLFLELCPSTLHDLNSTTKKVYRLKPRIPRPMNREIKPSLKAYLKAIQSHQCASCLCLLFKKQLQRVPKSSTFPLGSLVARQPTRESSKICKNCASSIKKNAISHLLLLHHKASMSLLKLWGS